MTEASSIYVRLEGQDVSLSALLTKVDAETQKTADSAARLQAQYARLASSQGNTSQATAILTNALQNNGGASERTVISLSQQLATVERGATVYQQFGQAAASSLTNIVGPAALATAAIGGLIAVGQSFAQAFQFKTQLDQSRASIDVLLKGVRDSGETFAGAAKFAAQYKLTQQETTEAIQSSIPVLRNSSASIEEVLGVFARLKVLKPEKTFGDAARAIGELQAGQIVSIVDQFNLSRSAANKMKDEIAKGGDAVQILSKYLTSAGVGMDALAVQTQGASGKMRELAQAQEQLKLAQAQFAQGPGLAILQSQIQTTSGATRLLSGDFAAMGASIQATIAGTSAYNTVISQGGTLTAAAAAQAAAYAAAIGQSTQATAQNTDRTKDDAVATAALATAISASAQSLVDETTKKLDSAVAAQRLAAFQEALANLGGAVAGGMQTASAAAAQLAAQYNITTGAALQLINAQAALAQAKVNAAALVEQRSGERSPGASGAAEAVAQEDRRLQALYRTLQSAPTKAKAGGGAKLSDQQKLNNQLLTDQDAANNKYEDAEAAHQERLLKIAIDFAKKTLEQQKLNEVSKRQSQADFYDRLTSSELNKKKGGTDALKAIDAEYQAAYQKSQELAQAGNAKLAADYLALKSKQTADELTYQENVAKAKEAKDSAEVGRLAQIHKLRQDAAAEEEKQLLAGGDANVTAKDQALQEESDKYASAQDKIGLASDRATERQIANAQRAGKAIDTTTLAIERQRQSYDGVGVAPGQSGGAAPVATTVGTPDQGAATPAPADPIASAIASLRDAISAVESATREAGRGVESAVRSIPRSVS
jgi:hypothetical protein